MKYTTKTKTILAALCSASVLLLSSCNDSSSSSNRNTSNETVEDSAPSIPQSLANTSFTNPNYSPSSSVDTNTFIFENLEITSTGTQAINSSDAVAIETGTFSFSGRGRGASSTESYNYTNIPYTYNPSTGVFQSADYYIGGYAEGTLSIKLYFDLASNGNVPIKGTYDIKNKWLSDVSMIVQDMVMNYTKQN